jgi:hypothetical protein
MRGVSGLLTATQQPAHVSATAFAASSVTVWDWSLNSDIPLDLDITAGNGASRLDVDHLNLTHLAVTAGTGRMQIDLEGPRAKEHFAGRLQ